MGTYTNTYRMYKADPSEFVDVTLDYNNNLDIVDNLAYFANPKVVSNAFNAMPAPTGLNNEPWYFSTADMSARIWNGLGWAFTDGSATNWQDLTPYLLSSFVPVAGYATAYRQVGKFVELRGRVCLPGFANITSNNLYNLINASAAGIAMPTRPMEFMTACGRTNEGTPEKKGYNILYVPANGSSTTITTKKNGAGFSTGNVENYISLSGVRIPIDGGMQ